VGPSGKYVIQQPLKDPETVGEPVESLFRAVENEIFHRVKSVTWSLSC